MACATILPEATTRHLAAEIARRPALGRRATAPGRRRLAEHFEVWTLASLEPLASGGRLKDVAHFTGRFHHQIRSGRTAREFARSVRRGSGDEDWTVEAVFHSPLAGAVSRAIAWVDARSKDDGETARLLSIPSRQAYALWLEGADRDRLVLVQKPGSSGGRAYRTFFTPAVFLETLRRGVSGPSLTETLDQPEDAI